MLNPKAAFLQEPEAKEFADLIGRASFKKACAYAIAQFALSLPPNSNVQSAWDNACKLEGARQMLQTLEYLVAPEPKPTLPSRALKPT